MKFVSIAKSCGGFREGNIREVWDWIVDLSVRGLRGGGEGGDRTCELGFEGAGVTLGLVLGHLDTSVLVSTKYANLNQPGVQTRSEGRETYPHLT